MTSTDEVFSTYNTTNPAWMPIHEIDSRQSLLNSPARSNKVSTGSCLSCLG
jgi:hypothetical protein